MLQSSKRAESATPTPCFHSNVRELGCTSPTKPTETGQVYDQNTTYDHFQEYCSTSPSLDLSQLEISTSRLQASQHFVAATKAIASKFKIKDVQVFLGLFNGQAGNSVTFNRKF